MIKKNLVCHNYFLKICLKNSAKCDTNSYNFNYDSFTHFLKFWFKCTNKILQEKTNF